MLSMRIEETSGVPKVPRSEVIYTQESPGEMGLM